ncbi:hypothetical protein KTF36_04935 [Burkholderia gladioli]|uniref:hypothetical protein n=1 Tax=Burkholderia gladioli TaxID=28095 RepID=UPI001C22A8CF|nr:hypothetical protein [Burkholderia gladioli]MBU9641193.1 hypothetical protein [Burkholderia gladioli]
MEYVVDGIGLNVEPRRLLGHVCLQAEPGYRIGPAQDRERQQDTAGMEDQRGKVLGIAGMQPAYRDTAEPPDMSLDDADHVRLSILDPSDRHAARVTPREAPLATSVWVGAACRSAIRTGFIAGRRARFMKSRP